jgi:hypothetical protein
MAVVAEPDNQGIFTQAGFVEVPDDFANQLVQRGDERRIYSPGIFEMLVFLSPLFYPL